jgi:chromosome segregation ATPase
MDQKEGEGEAGHLAELRQAESVLKQLESQFRDLSSAHQLVVKDKGRLQASAATLQGQVDDLRKELAACRRREEESVTALGRKDGEVRAAVEAQEGAQEEEGGGGLDPHARASAARARAQVCIVTSTHSKA